MVKLIKNIWRNINLLNLDIVAGAMINHVVFCKLIGVENLISATILGGSTSIIYISDRFLDIRQNPQINTERHLFHAKNKRNLSLFVGFLAIFNIFLLFNLAQEIIFFGIFLILLTAFYSWFVFRYPHLQSYHKEIFVALIYALGVVGSAFIQHKTALNFQICWVGINFFLVALQSLFLFSYFELLEDNSNQNIAFILGKTLIKYLIGALFFLVVLSVFYLNGFAQKIGIVECLMAGILFGMLFFAKKLLNNQLYRQVGDAVFLLPILLLY